MYKDDVDDDDDDDKCVFAVAFALWTGLASVLVLEQ